MNWLKSLRGKSGPPLKTGGTFRRSGVAYQNTWDPDKAITEAMNKVTWVFRSMDAIASNQAKLPLVFRTEDSVTGEEAKQHPTYSMLNSLSNVGENSFAFRYRLSSQLLISTKGVFVEIVRGNGGTPIALVLLPSQYTTPIPDPKKFVKGYEVNVPGLNKVTLKPENVMWIRKPHPMDPYTAITPLESAGLAVETDWLARLYNRNFMLNDGRPGGMVVIKGSVTEEDKEELRSRYRGNLATTGRVSVVSSEEGADFVDTAVTPRDAQYVDARKLTKEEILMAFGVPESVLANAAGRTYDNAEQERLIFWMETMSAHLELLSRAFDVLDEDPEMFAAFDTSSVDVIQRAEMKRREFLMKEWMEGLISQDEYRTETRRSLLITRGNRLYVPKTRLAVATTDGEEIPDLAALPAPNEEGRPPGEGADVAEVDEEEPQERTPPLLRAASAQGLHPSQTAIPEVTLRLVSGEKSEPLPLPAPIVKVKLGPWMVVEEDLLRFKQAVLGDLERWEAVAEKTLVRFFARQKRVVTEKILGSKSRRAYRALGDPEDRVALKSALDVVYDTAVWNEQLLEDMQGLLKDVMAEFGQAMARKLGTDWNQDDVALLAAVERERDRILQINMTTEKRLEAVRLRSQSPEEFAEQAREVFEDAAENRAPMAATTQVVGAANSARLVAMQATADGGLKKAWVTVGDSSVRETHLNREGETVALDEAFSGGIQYPGAYDAPAEEVINCRCTIVPGRDTGLVL